jgi:TolB protein
MTGRPVPLTAATLFSILAVLLIAAVSISAEPLANIGVVRPTTRQKVIIAIPDFQPKPGSSLLPKNILIDVIYNDLELSGYFVKPGNQKFVEDNQRLDERKGSIDFAEWARLNASFLVKGTYTAQGNSLEAECMLYEVPSGKIIFGRKFTGYTAGEHRTLAHRIADEIVKYITGEAGIANTKIVFISTRTGSKEVFAMDSDGFNQHPLTLDRSLDCTPCWGANGTEIYYTTYKDFNPDLAGVSMSGGTPWWISRLPGFNLAPAWSEKAQRIALTLGKDGNSEIYTMDRTGKSLKRLTFNRAIDASPSWSPEGNQIVFTSDRDGSPQIYVMNSEGFGVKRLTFQGTYNDSAVWSPKGDKIAFVARLGGIFDIYLMNVDGTNWVQLTQNQDNNEDPSWAPDGQHLAFTSNRTGKPQVYVMCIDGTGQRQLTFEGTNTSPSWSPAMP